MTVRDPRVLVTDLRSAFTDALSYVISSRIESIEQIFFSHSLPRKKFKCSQTVLEEIDRLEDISINNNPTAWFQTDEDYIKISALNVYKLDRHFEDLKSDVSLMESSLICCVETVRGKMVSRPRQSIKVDLVLWSTHGSSKRLVHRRSAQTPGNHHREKDY